MSGYPLFNFVVGFPNNFDRTIEASGFHVKDGHLEFYDKNEWEDKQALQKTTEVKRFKYPYYREYAKNLIEMKDQEHGE